MSIAKTLIQKEIDRQRRGVQIDTDEIKRLTELKKEDKEERMSDEDIDSYIKSHENRTKASLPIIKELEADLKKL